MNCTEFETLAPLAWGMAAYIAVQARYFCSRHHFEAKLLFGFIHTQQQILKKLQTVSYSLNTCHKGFLLPTPQNR